MDRGYGKKSNGEMEGREVRKRDRDEHNRDKQMRARSHQLGAGILKQNV